MNDPITCIRSSAQGSINCSRSNNFQSNLNSDFRPLGQGCTSQTFANRSKYSHAATSAPTHNYGSMSCFYSNQSHLMTNCKCFQSLSVNDRRQFCWSQRLCFGCLAKVTQIETAESACTASSAIANTQHFFMMTAGNKRVCTTCNIEQSYRIYTI